MTSEKCRLICVSAPRILIHNIRISGAADTKITQWLETSVNGSEAENNSLLLREVRNEKSEVVKLEKDILANRCSFYSILLYSIWAIEHHEPLYYPLGPWTR